MERGLLMVVLAAVVGGLACGGAKGTSPTPGTTATAPVSTALPQPTPVTNISGNLTVTGGAQGASASATMRTTPGALCSIVYYHPSGLKSTAKALSPKTAAPDGIVTWIWVIAPKTVPTGRGTVDVTCGSDKASAAITITP